MKIKNLVRDGNKVMWTIVYEDYAGQVKKIACTTNENGEGLFLVKYGWELHQINGTCQFSLTQKTISGVRSALNRYFDSETLDWIINKADLYGII